LINVNDKQLADKQIEYLIAAAISDYPSPAHFKGDSLGITSINKLLTDVLLLVSSAAAMQGINVKKSMSSEVPSCLLDAGQIKQAILHIFRNALQAMPQGGTLKIQTSYFVQDEEICICISDTGEGIPLKNRKKVFDPFFSTKTEGLGLGLTLTKVIVKRHNGHVLLESVVGKGTTVYLYIPVQLKLDVMPQKFSRIGVTALHKEGRVVFPKRVRDLSNEHKKAEEEIRLPPAGISKKVLL